MEILKNGLALLNPAIFRKIFCVFRKIKKCVTLNLGCKCQNVSFEVLPDILRWCFWPEIPFLGKFGPKNQNCQVKMKFGT